MRKFLITMMCVIMVVCFMPTVAMAGTSSTCTGGESCTHEAQIGSVHYDTINEAILAASAGDTITLINNAVITLDSSQETGLRPQITVDKSIVLDLNRKSIKYSAVAGELDYIPAFFAVNENATLTITGEGTIDTSLGSNGAYGLNVMGGTVIVENGTFIGGPTVFQVQTGSLVVNGGSFSLTDDCQERHPDYAKYLVNCIDGNFQNRTAKIRICGGKFVNFNPSYNPEGDGTSYVVPGYAVSEEPGNGETKIYSINRKGTSVAEVKDNNGNITGAYETVVAAVNAATAGQTVTLLQNVDIGNETIVVNKAITIDGGANKYSISSTASNVIKILTNGGTLEGEVKLLNLKIKATNFGKTGRAIGIGDRTSITKLNLNVEGCIIETTQRGITTNPNGNNGINLTVKDSTISLTNGITDYDSKVDATNNFENSRGISLWQMGNSTVSIISSTIQGFFYSVNNTGGAEGKEDSMVVNMSNSIFKGRAAINAHACGTIWNVTGCNIRGINTFGGGSEGFATIMLDSLADNNKLNIESSIFTTYFNEVGQNNPNATEYLVGLRGNNCSAIIDENTVGTQYTVFSDEKGGLLEPNSGSGSSLVIYNGKYSQDPTVFLADGKFASKETTAKNALYVVHEHSTCNFGHTYCPATCPDTCHTLSHYIPPTPTTPTDNVTNSGSTATDNASTNADLSGSTSTSNGTTTATVDKTTADKIVDKAVENKSTEVVIDATANTTTATNSTTIAQVTIPTETLGAIAEKTEADVTIKTDVAEVKMDNTAAAAVSEQATGDTVQIVAEKVAEETDKVEFELKVVCSDGKVISNFNGGNIAVTVALPKAMAEKKLVCVYIDDNGHMSKVEGQKNADGTYTFNTGHFSSYAIMAEEEADAAIAAQKEAIKNIKIKLTSKQVKTKSGKKGIKITWTAAAGDKILDGVEVFRSKERYKGYGTEPFYTSTKGGNEGSYINTKSLKKGTKYYYRVRGYVLVDGQKVYTDYSTKAWRTFK